MSLRFSCASIFFSMLRRQPISTLFPYTTLFRSRMGLEREHAARQAALARPAEEALQHRLVSAMDAVEIADGQRSEEHTSELQSQFHLVCRLLLEKKKKNTVTNSLGIIHTTFSAK